MFHAPIIMLAPTAAKKPCANIRIGRRGGFACIERDLGHRDREEQQQTTKLELARQLQKAMFAKHTHATASRTMRSNPLMKPAATASRNIMDAAADGDDGDMDTLSDMVNDARY